LVATLNYGCGKKEAPPAGQKPAAGEQKTPAVVSVEKTSFTEVTSQLDPGGNFYLYLGTAQWLDGLSTKVGHWRQTVAAMPGLKPDNTTNVNKAFDIVSRLIKDSGIEDVSGVGLSSVEIEKGMFRNKALLHHYPAKALVSSGSSPARNHIRSPALTSCRPTLRWLFSRTWTCRCSGPLRKRKSPKQPAPGAGMAGETPRQI